MANLTIIVDYGSGNLASVWNMGRKAGGDMRISSSPEEVALADKLILPGVGAFDRAMENLANRGLVEALNHAVITRKVPILGACLGVQLFTRRSEEGTLPGLGWIAADTVRFTIDRDGSGQRVPHMGWNTVEIAKPDPVTADLGGDARFYFVHSYHLVCDNPEDVMLWTHYGLRFASAISKENIWGTQFHPEKSHRFGLALMRRFLALSC